MWTHPLFFLYEHGDRHWDEAEPLHGKRCFFFLTPFFRFLPVFFRLIHVFYKLLSKILDEIIQRHPDHPFLPYILDNLGRFYPFLYFIGYLFDCLVICLYSKVGIFIIRLTSLC